MNNKEFITELAKRQGVTQQSAQQMASTLVENILSQTEQDGICQIPLFGTFEVKKRLERILVNPNNGNKMLVPPKLVLNFKPVTNMKDQLQQKIGGENND